jgi:hypothetical protein
MIPIDHSEPSGRICVRTPRLRLGWAVLAGVLLLQLWSRYMPSPWAVFVADDWANLARSSFYTSHVEAARAGLQDPNRPLSMLAVEVVYRVFGTRALPWTMLSLAANSILLLALMKMAMELTGRRWTAAATGINFALLPNLVETYHWSTQILNEVFCGLMFYGLSGWMGVAYFRRGGAWRLGLSALSYGVGLFSYEAGILLPAAFLALLPWKAAPVKSLMRMVPFGLVGLLYLGWRTTDAFGLNQAVQYPPHMQAGISLWRISWHARQLVHWWAGDHLFACLLNGLRSFATLSPWVRRGLVLGNVAVVLLIGRGLRRLGGGDGDAEESRRFSNVQAWGFALAWSAAAMAIPLLSYTASRLMVIPAMGISVLAALALSRWPIRSWGPFLFLPAVLALASNQGTAESFRQVGQFNRRIYAHLDETKADWRDKPILLFDTRALRQRLTPGLLRPAGEDSATWARYGNALLIRGFLPRGMVQRITGEKNPPVLVLHDVEHGARIEAGRLRWHVRYQPTQTHETPLSDVFVVDCLAVGQGTAASP